MMREGETQLSGLVASQGLAIGQLRASFTAAGPLRDDGPAAVDLETALAAARGELEALADGAGEMAAEIIEFQQALLADEALTEPVAGLITEGRSPAAAWHEVMDGMIAEYREGDDAYFQARAEDLEDLRDRVAAHLSPERTGAAGEPGGDILVTETLTPSRFLEVDWSATKGAVTLRGSPSSHVAMLARARGIPLIVGVDAGPPGLWQPGRAVILDAEAGSVILSPSADTAALYGRRIDANEARARAEAALLPKPAVTVDGTPVTVLVNIDDIDAIKSLDPAHCDGVGLTRTEFLFTAGSALPDEEVQYRAYRRLAEWAAGKPVTIRTLDAGGDKPIEGLTAREDNAFLGQRGLRLSLARPEVFGVQLRALARAAVHGEIKVMVPMVTAPWEMEKARDLLDAAVVAARDAGHAVRRPALGMMVEVPAAALMVERFRADFFSIGSNDLIQYVTAASRDNAAVSALYDPACPAVLELIGRVVAHGEKVGIAVSLCGDMAASPPSLVTLLGLGLACVSVAPAALGRAKAAIAGCRLG